MIYINYICIYIIYVLHFFLANPLQDQFFRCQRASTFLSSSCAFTNLHNQLMNKIWPSMQVERLKTHHDLHDLHGFTTEMLFSEFVKLPVYQAPSPRSRDSFNMDFQNELTDLTSSQNHSKYIQNIHQFGLLRDYLWNSSIEMFAPFKIIKLAQLIFARFRLIQLDLSKTCPVNLPFLMIGENFPTNFKPTRLHEFSGENTAHVQVLGVGFKGFVVAQNLCSACRRHWRNQQGIAQTMLCLYPRWLGREAGRDVHRKFPEEIWFLKKKNATTCFGGDFFGVLLEMIFCLTWKTNLKVVHWQPPPPL